MIIITRPTQSARSLCQLLEQNNIAYKHMPLIDIIAGRDSEHVDEKISQLPEGSIIIALSQYAAAAIHQIPKSNNYTYLAIGKTTAATLEKKVNCPVFYPKTEETSEHFLLLPQLQNIDNKSILILKGRGGRKTIIKTLLKRGAKVNYCECYQRIFTPCDTNKLTASWKNYARNIIVVTSSEILYRLSDLIPIAVRNERITDYLVVVSQRTAETAKKLGWKNIVISPYADNMTLFNTITHLNSLGMNLL